jgi:hypothetical protein
MLIDFLMVVAIVWGLKMVLQKHRDGWGLGNWIGVMMIAGAAVFRAVVYMLTHSRVL